MAKVTFSTDIQSISGKLCKKEGVIYSVNKQTGKTYRSDHHTFSNPNTEKQQAVRTSFKDKSTAASAWWNANKPSDTNPSGTADYQLLIKRYKAQHKYGNPYAYLRSLVQDDLTIRISTTATAPTLPPSTDDTSSGSDGERN